MADRKSYAPDDVVRWLLRLLLAVLLVAAVTGVCYLVVLSPLLIYAFYDDDRDWARLGDMGQAYGPASALLSTVALLVVAASLLVQRNNFRHMLRADHRRRTRETVMMSMAEPAYAQCWGARFAPAHVDERLFFFASFVLLNWSFAWEDRLINEPKLRELLRAYFDSEIPRMYWERHGDWHNPRRRWPRREQFEAIVNEEYLCAIKSGSPSRRYEPAAATR
ncbi:DUF6082 family protein [Dactylosporangium sp. AC04546]|uniref:DUF6082 family protein n=1 Tax=Dactylosporangium sp. AC04546 TaxID=2862460 RepID=UPI001EE0EA27|nr:DUF6082 family protein [Dactylosporangium sp. AC04546]WVK78445.1 DUF6082 family protein [Dactylosporangium sp. AC04546]